MNNLNEINAQNAHLDLYEIDIILKGQKEITTLQVRAKNRLDASNTLILNKIYGKQKEIRISNINLLKNK